MAKANLDIGALVGYITNLSENAVVNCHATGIINEQKISTGTNGGRWPLIGHAGGGIKDSSFTGIIRSYGGGYYTGGLVGSWEASTQKCWANAEIDAENTISGLVGDSQDIVEGWGSHAYNYSITNIISARQIVGGLQERTKRPNTLNCWARGKVQGSFIVGGFAGLLEELLSQTAMLLLLLEGDEDVGGFVGQDYHRNS